MKSSVKRKLETQILGLSVMISLLILLLSFLNGYSLTATALRAVFSLGTIYILGKGLLFLWIKVFPEEKPKAPKPVQIDFIVDGNPVPDLAPGERQGRLPGQINLDKDLGIESAGKKAEIIRRMGWGEEI